MKKILLITLLSIISTTAFADYRQIGETRDCRMKVKVFQETSGSHALAVFERKSFKLDLVRKRPGMKFYRTPSHVFPSFEALIMEPELSRLSELQITLSGTRMRCLIDL